MTNSPVTFPFTTPLTAANHRIADGFYQQHSDAQKATQVYLNTLSVQAVNFYLTCLGIQTSLARSQSWNPVLQVLIDTADLWVDGLGSLECRPMLADANGCVVPAQALVERIGYVVVRLNRELTEATLLGFVPSIETETLHLEALQAIDELPGYLNQLLTQLAPAASQSTATRLSNWFHTVTDTGWKTLEMLIGEWQEQPALSFRTPANLPVLEPSEVGAKRGKLLKLGNAPNEHVLLLIEVTPTRTASEYQINLELCPIGKEVYLPRSLHLALLDEAGKTVLQAENSDSEGLEFQFSGELGEHFSIKVSHQGCHVVETFEI
jgi:Protein of unknown function (DUF1822)